MKIRVRNVGRIKRQWRRRYSDGSIVVVKSGKDKNKWTWPLQVLLVFNVQENLHVWFLQNFNTTKSSRFLPISLPPQMDPNLKRCSQRSTICLTDVRQECSSGLSCSVSSNPNPVLTKTSSLKPRKPSTSLQNLLQCKSLSRSADFEASGRLQAQSKHHTKYFSGEQKMEKEVRQCSEFKSGKEKVNVRTLPHEEEKKEVYCKLKGSSKEGVEVSLVGVQNELKRLSLGGCPVTVGIGRRSSLFVSHSELRDILTNNGAKVVAVDMPPFMQIHAVDCARRTNDSLEKFSSKSLALTLKKEFDGVYGPAWHCIVGKSFGSFVTHSVGGFLYFTMDQKLYILLFKTTVQRA